MKDRKNARESNGTSLTRRDFIRTGALAAGSLLLPGGVHVFGAESRRRKPNVLVFFTDDQADIGVGYASKEELFATADIVTIHVVLSQRSRGLVGAADLARMKPTGYLVNTARGPIVDEAALLQTLQQNKIAGAAVDVFSVEPLPTDHPFRKLDNLVLTPHLGYVTEESFRAHYSQMIEGIEGWIKGEPMRRLA